MTEKVQGSFRWKVIEKAVAHLPTGGTNLRTTEKDINGANKIVTTESRTLASCRVKQASTTKVLNEANH